MNIGPKPNLLDRLNPVTRLGLAVVMSIAILVTLDWLSGLIMLTGQLTIYLACRVGPGQMLSRMRPVIVVAPIGAVSMALYGKPGGRIWWHWLLISVSDNSLKLSVAVFIRILALGLGAVILLGGSDATRMADGLAQIVRLPSRFVLGTLAGMRTIGLFINDWRMLSLARRARGLGDSGRIHRFVTMAFALLVFAIRRGTKLATAMEARGFGTSRIRTWARPSRLAIPDLVGLLVTLALCALELGVAVWLGTFWFVGS